MPDGANPKAVFGLIIAALIVALLSYVTINGLSGCSMACDSLSGTFARCLNRAR